MAKGKIKPEFAGQTHPDFGLLVEGVEYEGAERAPALFTGTDSDAGGHAKAGRKDRPAASDPLNQRGSGQPKGEED